MTCWPSRSRLSDLSHSKFVIRCVPSLVTCKPGQAESWSQIPIVTTSLTPWASLSTLDQPYHPEPASGYSNVLSLIVLREPTYREHLSWEGGKGGDPGCHKFWGYRMPFILHPSVHSGLRQDPGLTAFQLPSGLPWRRGAGRRTSIVSFLLCTRRGAGGGDVILLSAVPMASLTLGWPQITEATPWLSGARDDGCTVSPN